MNIHTRLADLYGALELQGLFFIQGKTGRGEQLQFFCRSAWPLFVQGRRASERSHNKNQLWIILAQDTIFLKTFASLYLWTTAAQTT